MCVRLLCWQMFITSICKASTHLSLLLGLILNTISVRKGRQCYCLMQTRELRDLPRVPLLAKSWAETETKVGLPQGPCSVHQEGEQEREWERVCALIGALGPRLAFSAVL